MWLVCYALLATRRRVDIIMLGAHRWEFTVSTRERDAVVSSDHCYDYHHTSSTATITTTDTSTDTTTTMASYK